MHAHVEPDLRAVPLGEPQRLREWASGWGVTVEELQEAVQAVGNFAGEVRFYLQSRRRLAPWVVTAGHPATDD